VTAGEVGEADPIARFAAAAERYCAWAESTPESAYGEVDKAIRLLLELVARVLDLPPTEPGEEDFERPTHEQWKAVFRRFATLPIQHYGTHSPQDLEDTPVLIGDLHDDLADVWRDIREGLAAYAAGDRDSACWQWSFSFGNHWGEHAAEALRVLVLTRHAG
jgi:hypothetical protein